MEPVRALSVVCLLLSVSGLSACFGRAPDSCISPHHRYLVNLDGRDIPTNTRIAQVGAAWTRSTEIEQPEGLVDSRDFDSGEYAEPPIKSNDPSTDHFGLGLRKLFGNDTNDGEWIEFTVQYEGAVTWIQPATALEDGRYRADDARGVGTGVFIVDGHVQTAPPGEPTITYGGFEEGDGRRKHAVVEADDAMAVSVRVIRRGEEIAVISGGLGMEIPLYGNCGDNLKIGPGDEVQVQVWSMAGQGGGWISMGEIPKF